MTTIAGHTFQEGPNGRRCTTTKMVDGITIVCNVAWLDIKDATQWDVDNKTPGLAHINFLNHWELSEIQKEEARLREKAWGAVTGVAAR